ncbi:MAG: hypothetical protein LBU04_02045 [Christensenellaceae bacterium]|jgi:hypothetical protein|nr:hypothetical protein [Christensenellaceae bacterium]
MLEIKDYEKRFKKALSHLKIYDDNSIQIKNTKNELMFSFFNQDFLRIVYPLKGSGREDAFLKKFLFSAGVLKSDDWKIKENESIEDLWQSINTSELEFEFSFSGSFLIPSSDEILINKLMENIINIYNACYMQKEPKLYFGCCHLYLECSQSGRCISKNLLLSKGCQYKKCLEIGESFLL